MTDVGVLALQGAVSEHLAMLGRAGMRGVPVKRREDLHGLSGLIIPGGESTAVSRLIRQRGLSGPIREFVRTRPVLGTCAGLILCAKEISGGGGVMPGRTDDGGREVNGGPEPLGLMDIAVSRNGFGRQVDSFETRVTMRNIGEDIPAVFIRAPYIERTGRDVTVLATARDKIVAAESGNALVTAFHPELTGDLRIFLYFRKKVENI
jgi:5'-phosphate synthase pdxT subunit